MNTQENNSTGTEDTSTRSRKKKWFYWIGGVVGLVVLLGLLTKYAILPGLIRWQVTEQLSKRWDGPVEIDDVDFDFSGAVQLSGLRLKDSHGRTWTQINRLEVEFSYLPNIAPTLTDVVADEVQFVGQIRNGQMVLPLKPAAPGPAEAEDKGKDNEQSDRFWPAGLEQVRVNRFVAAFENERGRLIEYRPIELAIQAGEETVEVRIQQVELTGQETLRLAGQIDPVTSQADLELALHRQISPEMTEPVLQALRTWRIQTVQGRLSTRDEAGDVIRITGPLNAPSRLRFEGQLGLQDVSIRTPHGLLVDKVNTAVQMRSGDSQRFEMPEFQADSGTGSIRANGTLVIGPAGQLEKLQALLETENLELAHVLPASGVEVKQSGRLHLLATVSKASDSTSWSDVRSDAAFRLDDAQLWDMPLAAAIFEHLQIGQYDPTSVSDVRGEFRSRGAVVTAQMLRLASTAYAIEARPGSQIDLESGKLRDFAVTAVPLQRVGDLLDRIPVVDVLTDIPAQLGKELSYMAVQGNIYGQVRVVPQTVDSLGKGTVEFFRKAADSGGQLFESVTPD
jgi:hypothetical protein